MRKTSILIEILYKIGMLGAVMELEGSSRVEHGISYEANIGEYTLASYFGSHPEDEDSKYAELNVVCVLLKKDGEYFGPVYFCRKFLNSEKYSQLFSKPYDNENNELREEFINEMLLESESTERRRIMCDQDYGLLKNDKEDLRIQIFTKFYELESEYIGKKLARNKQ